MKRDKKLKNPVASFILLSNIIFFPLFCLVGVISILEFPAWIFDMVFCVSSWSSTFAFVILFKKIFPDQSLIKFVKDQFKKKLKPSIIVIASMIQAAIFLIILFLISQNQEVGSTFTISSWPHGEC